MSTLVCSQGLKGYFVTAQYLFICALISSISFKIRAFCFLTDKTEVLSVKMFRIAFVFAS